MSELLWQRPKAITIAFFMFRQLKLLVSNFSNFIPMLSALFVTGITLSALLWIGLGYLVVLIVGAVLSYRYFAFAVVDETLHVRSGIFNRQQLTLKFARIQQAEIKQPWYFRPFNLTIIGVDSAGSSGKEIEIPGLSFAAAQQLRQQLLAGRSDTVATATAADTFVTEQDTYQQQFSVPELLRGGLMDNKVWLLLAVLGYPLSQLNVFENYIGPWLEQQSVSWAQTPAVTVAVAVLAGIILLFLAGLIMTLMTDYGLTLRIANNRFHAQSGLLSIRSLSFRYHKLQRVVFKQNLRGRLLQRWSLALDQLRPTTRQQSQQQVFRLPVLDAQMVATLRQHLHLPDPSLLDWRGLPAAALFGASVLLLMVTVIALGFTLITAQQVGVGVLLISGGWLLVQLWLVAGWHRYRYAYDANWLVVRQGVLGQRERWYPLYKVQQININQSPWQRLFGLVSVQVIGAAGQEQISWQPAASAYSLQQQWLSAIRSSDRSWM